MKHGIAWLVFAAGCAPRDYDEDGFLDTVDCKDGEKGINPAAVEVCNGVDDNCDGMVDEGLMATWYTDLDHDGFGDPATEVTVCERPDNTIALAGDCDDSDNAIRPGAPERCNEIDDDCDGATDENLATTWYADNDHDGAGGELIEGCDPPDDAATAPGDCDDDNPAIGPAVIEICDGIDQDCDTLVDEGVGTPFFPDNDQDGYGDAGAISTNVCDGQAPAGMVQDNTDCDDTTDLIFAGAPEVCDEIDNDCDTDIDEGVALPMWQDLDEDGYGDPAVKLFGCAPGDGLANNPYDCDDNEPLAYTGAVEVCDLADNDCDGSTDEDVEIRWYDDADGDGWGDASAPIDGCTPPADVVFVGEDCDDTDAEISPEGDEICDLADNDCDGMIDESGFVAWWTDADSDGFGDDATFQTGCVVPSDGVLVGGDCDDADDAVSPVATEVCDLVDQNCDGVADEGLARIYWSDADGDGFGTTDQPPVRACTPPVDHAEAAGDCDDLDQGVGAGDCTPSVTGTWGTWGGDDGRTGHVPGLVTGGLLTSLWTFTDVGRTAQPAAIANGAVVVTGSGASDVVTSWDLASGVQNWQFVLVPALAPSGPTVEGGRVLVQRINAADSYVVAIDEVAGTQVFRSNMTAGSDNYRGPLVYDGKIFAGGGTLGGVYAYDATTGLSSWFSGHSAQYDDWTPVGEGGVVYAQVGDQLLGYDPTNGDLLVDLTLPSGPPTFGLMATVPAMADGVALLIAGDDLVAVDLVNQDIRWVLEDGFSGSPTIADGLGYAIRDGAVSQFDLADGFLVREFPGNGALIGKPVVTDDAVIAASSSEVFVYQLWDGLEVDHLLFGGTLAVGEGVLALTATDTTRVFTW